MPEAEGSLSEWLRFIGAQPQERNWVPAWPPDAFAIAAALLRRTGAYVGLINGTHSRTRGRTSGSRAAVDAGVEWRKSLDETLRGSRSGSMRDACPPQVKQWWQEFVRCEHEPFDRSTADLALAEAAANLCIASDVASAGIGLASSVQPTGQSEDPFLAMADIVLQTNQRRSFCLHVPATKLAVLGKQHTPQRGCTIRSLTHHLALYAPTEIRAHWYGPYSPVSGDLDVFNLLLLPWPADVRAGDFRVAPPRRGPGGGLGGPRVHRYFDYEPQAVESPAALAQRVSDALDVATTIADQVHGIVLPELSLTREQFEAAERVALRRKALLISGVRYQASRESNDMPLNACVIQPAGLTAAQEDAARSASVREEMRLRQLKHHRWCLDRNQILQYELGGRLPASYDCWEHVFVRERDLNFVTLTSWLTMCVLICEDLARQDPVSEVIRAVGPNLVVALLMDGPQLRNRWPSRYASVLAEDPGSSVLTLTSLGMSKRSRPREEVTAVPDRSTTIALWRDAVYGEREIALGPGHDACVLSLVCKKQEEFTIDGRGDAQTAQFPVYAGAFPFATRPPAATGRL